MYDTSIPEKGEQLCIVDGNAWSWPLSSVVLGIAVLKEGRWLFPFL